MDRRRMLLAMGAMGLAGPALAGESRSLQAVVQDAWIYLLPLVEMAHTRERHLAEGRRLNQFAHVRQLADDTSRIVTTPNNDTLYSIGWIDLSQGPLTLTVPATGERYWSIGMMDMYTNNNAVLGSRTAGGAGGTFTIVGPGQAGDGPDVLRMATPHGWLLIRVLVDGEADLPAVHAIQDGFTLKGPAGAAPPPVGANRASGWADYFTAAQKLLLSDPPPATDRAALAAFARLGLTTSKDGTPFDAARVPAADQAAFTAGVETARGLIQVAMGRQRYINGWSYPRADLGDYGQDYGYRAVVAVAGLAALTPEEAMYMRAQGDGQGLFSGAGPWKLSLPGDIPVDGFWSLSMYEATADGQFFFTPNAIKRFAIGDRTAGLKRNADGGVDIWISRTDPGPDHRANWLPAPASGPFGLFLRTYLPRPALLDGAWRVPAVTAG